MNLEVLHAGLKCMQGGRSRRDGQPDDHFCRSRSGHRNCGVLTERIGNLDNESIQPHKNILRLNDELIPCMLGHYPYLVHEVQSWFGSPSSILGTCITKRPEHKACNVEHHEDKKTRTIKRCTLEYNIFFGCSLSDSSQSSANDRPQTLLFHDSIF